MGGNISNINETFIVESIIIEGSGSTSPIISACTAVLTNNIVSCDGDAEIFMGSGETTFNTSLIPTIDSNIDLGTTIKRFREINTVSGTTSVWVSNISITSPILNLGLDLSGNTRQITANNSIIQGDNLLGGQY